MLHVLWMQTFNRMLDISYSSLIVLQTQIRYYLSPKRHNVWLYPLERLNIFLSAIFPIVTIISQYMRWVLIHQLQCSYLPTENLRLILYRRAHVIPRKVSSFTLLLPGKCVKYAISDTLGFVRSGNIVSNGLTERMKQAKIRKFLNSSQI